MYLLDTNIISELRKLPKGKADAGVAEWAKTVGGGMFYTSVVVMMELERGILRMEHKDPPQGTALRLWLERTVKPSFCGRILPVGSQTAEICARLHLPDLSPENDAWIAATALEHSFTLVTRNVRDFRHTGAKLLNPFQAA